MHENSHPARPPLVTLLHPILTNTSRAPPLPLAAPRVPTQLPPYSSPCGYSLDVEPKVELPGADSRSEFPVLVGEGEAELNDPEQVDVASQGLVVVVARTSE